MSAVGVGIGAGAALLTVMCIDAAARGDSAYSPFSLTASLALGEAALHSDAPFVVLLGIVFGSIAAVTYGFAFSWVIALAPRKRHSSWLRHMAIGAAFGAVVYFVSFHVAGRLFFPWVLQAEQLSWFLAHTLVFGPLLAVMYAVGLRRERERVAAAASVGTQSGFNPAGVAR